MTKTEKYLHKYSKVLYEIESAKRECRYAVVVPALAEYSNLPRFLDSYNNLDKTYFDDTLLLFVINNHKDSSTEVKEDNQKSLQFLREMIHQKSKSGLHIGVIDAASEGEEFPEKYAGVGLARKTGMDTVLGLFSNNLNGLLICTDADCTFEKNYLTEVVNNFRNGNTHAAVINFRHNTDDELTADAVINYELFLRYYVAGLSFSRSSYSFHTIGSSMVCTADAYISVEGMNIKKAAEDFYFIEKLAKQYPIKKIHSTTVYPDSRKSWRVPFGTGQRVNRFLDNTRNEYTLYHPDIFKVLAEWHNIFLNTDILTAREYLNMAQNICPVLSNYLAEQDFEKDWNSILKNSRKMNILQRQKIQWFDGFRTLKLVHFLRDNKYGVIPMFDALDEMLLMYSAGVIKRTEKIPDRSVQLKYLEKIREIDR
jgi:hypothetical protein